jgi:hypothetical protein
MERRLAAGRQGAAQSGQQKKARFIEKHQRGVPAGGVFLCAGTPRGASARSRPRRVRGLAVRVAGNSRTAAGKQSCARARDDTRSQRPAGSPRLPACTSRYLYPSRELGAPCNSNCSSSWSRSALRPGVGPGCGRAARPAGWARAIWRHRYKEGRATPRMRAITVGDSPCSIKAIARHRRRSSSAALP